MAETCSEEMSKSETVLECSANRKASIVPIHPAPITPICERVSFVYEEGERKKLCRNDVP